MKALFLMALGASLMAVDERRPAGASAAQGYNLDANKIALKGYDPVSYFVAKGPLKGKREVTAEYQGATYQFASAQNRALFVDSPQKYLPAYGGWCATAMAKGEKVEIDPANYKVTNGRLFLFYKGLFGNALNDWNKDEPTLTAQADAHWRKISKE
ncbi:MAG: YHS domain-containing (seleno)protein [Verrucomicrobiota bacterium]